MNHHAKATPTDQTANDMPTGNAEQPKVEQPKVEQPLATESKSPIQQTANRMPVRADNLFSLGKRHI